MDDQHDKKKSSVFSKKSIVDKQNLAREEYEKKTAELRKSFEAVAATGEGEKVFKFLFLICGGDAASIRRDKEGAISTDETLVTLGSRSVWDAVRFNLRSDTLKKIERHNWE